MSDFVLKIKKLFIFWNHGNRGTLFLFNTHECQKIPIKNPFGPILGFGLIKNFLIWIFLSLEKNIFTKDFQRIHIIKLNWW
jgi:hypothetical protein